MGGVIVDSTHNSIYVRSIDAPTTGSNLDASMEKLLKQYRWTDG